MIDASAKLSSPPSSPFFLSLLLALESVSDLRRFHARSPRSVAPSPRSPSRQPCDESASASRLNARQRRERVKQRQHGNTSSEEEKVSSAAILHAGLPDSCCLVAARRCDLVNADAWCLASCLTLSLLGLILFLRCVFLLDRHSLGSILRVVLSQATAASRKGARGTRHRRLMRRASASSCSCGGRSRLRRREEGRWRSGELWRLMQLPSLLLLLLLQGRLQSSAFERRLPELCCLK